MDDSFIKYRILYVRYRLAGAALNRNTSQVFNDLVDFETQFKHIFIRELQTLDKWDLLKRRYHSKSEHVMDYVVDQIRLC